jgi:hypothetical protein
MRNVEQYKPVTSMPAANTNYVVPFPPGAYHISVAVVNPGTNSSTAATIGLRPFVDKARSKVGPLLNLVTPDETIATTVSLVTAASNEFYTVRAATSGVGLTPVTLPYGARLVLTVGSYTAAVAFETVITGARVV